MSGAWLVTYALVFVAGPLIVFWQLRPEPSIAALRRLGIVMLVAIFVAFGAMFLGACGALIAGLLWLAWVLSMALLGHVLRLVIGGTGHRRWTAAVAAAGAVLPWFGLLMARSMAG